MSMKRARQQVQASRELVDALATILDSIPSEASAEVNSASVHSEMTGGARASLLVSPRLFWDLAEGYSVGRYDIDISRPAAGVEGSYVHVSAPVLGVHIVAAVRVDDVDSIGGELGALLRRRECVA